MPTLSQAQVIWLQSRLTSHGFPVGAIDGAFGKITAAALKAFQQKNNIPATGLLDQPSIDALRKTSVLISPAIAGQIPNRDAPAATSKSCWPSQDDVPKVFGAVGTSQTQIEVPFDMCLAWDRSTKIRKITVHQKVAPSAQLVFEKVAGIYSLPERDALGISVFGGSLNVRKMRGGTRFSMHSWGIALDFDPERNQLHEHAPQARLSHADAIPFWEAWEAEGWVSLGRAKNFDFMHVQAARI